MPLPVQEIQRYLKEHNVDGWLLADFHSRNEIAVQFLQLPTFLTRRFFYFIPREGSPIALVHNIEKMKFTHLPGSHVTFSAYTLLESELRQVLEGSKTIAMEYTVLGRLPYLGMVDAGTIELIRSFGVEIVSSADLVAYFQSRLTVEQIALHRMAARNLIDVKDKTFAFIAHSLSSHRRISEYDVMQFMLAKFSELDMVTDHGPNCSVGANAGNPHYEPTPEHSAEITRDQLVLIDLWAKSKHSDAVYADITWMAFTGHKREIPAKFLEIFNVLVQARDSAIQFLREHIDSRAVYGYEVDDACRAVVKKAGYDRYFFHRTGHSITTTVHGTGPNIDNLETEDRRRLQKGHLFSIEPGIYMNDCGFRTEVDVLIGHDGVEVTTLPLQSEITPLF